MNAVVIFHSVDMDGWTSGWVITKFLTQVKGLNIDDIFYYGYNYNSSLRKLEAYLGRHLVNNTLIFMADVTLPEKFMEQYADHIVWLDHHKSAIEKGIKATWSQRLYKNYASSVDNYNRPQASCLLCWRKLFGGKPVPRFVQLSSDYDIWDLSNPETKYFQSYIQNILYMKYVNKKTPVFLEPEFDALESSDLQQEIAQGKDILLWKEKIEAIECLRQAKQMYIGKTPIAIINKRGINSEFFTAIVKEYPYIQCLVSFGYDLLARSWTVSFYSAPNKNFDALGLMTKICEQGDPKTMISYGGHPGACGMNTYDIENDFLKHINTMPQ